MAKPDKLGLMRLENSNVAAGLAYRLLAGEAPFRDMPFGSSAGSLLSAIERNHYTFATRGDRAVGFTSWMFTDIEIAEKWGREGRPFDKDSYKEDGAAAVGLIMVGNDAAATRFLFRTLRDIGFADRNLFYFMRDYGPDKPRRIVRLVRPVSRGRPPAS